MKKHLVSAAFILLSGGAIAAEQSSSSDLSTWEKLRQSPLGLQFLHETDTEKDADNSINGFSTINIVYLKYKLTDKDSLRLENRVSTVKTEGNDFDARWARMVLKYSRTILTEKEAPVGLSAAAELRHYPSTKERADRDRNGHGRLSVTLTKSVGKFDFSNTVYGAVTQTKSDSPTTTTAYWLGGFSQTYNFTDKLNLTSLIEPYLNYKEVGNQAGVDWTLELGYSVTKDLSVWTNVAASVVAKNKYIEDFHKASGFGLGFAYTLF